MTSSRNQLAADFVAGFSQAPQGTLIRNAATTMILHDWGGVKIPLTINSGEANGTFVCCPRIGWVDFVRHELTHFPNPRLVPLLKGIVKGLEWLAYRCDLDRIVHVNNWMMSTNLPSGIDPDLSAAQTRSLAEQFPDHIIAMRSLNRRHESELMDALGAAGWVFLPTRQVFIVDDVSRDSLTRRDSKRDARLWERSEFHDQELTHMTSTDSKRIADLYALLYLEKHSYLNPQYSPAFITFAHDIGLLRFLVLRDDEGVIQAVGGLQRADPHATMPLLGYNTSLDQRIGLYRMICHAGSLYAARHKLHHNRSSGVTAFKQSRGATPEIEYAAYYVRHLPRKRRTPFRILEGIGTHIGIPILQKYSL